MRYCLQPGCPTLVPRGYCPAHARDTVATRRWYRIARWSRLRQAVLVEANYTCAQCGQVRIDLDVDHIAGHGNDPQKFWDRANLQALCRVCHARKTRRG